MATRLLGALLVACVALTACTDSDGPEPEPTSAPPPLAVVDLEFGVWGTDEEVAAYRDVVEVYDEETDEVNVKVRTYPTHRDLVEAIQQGAVPDVFLADRSDLATLLEEDVTQPIGERLDERDVDFGDDYSRAALEAFSFDRDLQCMPYGISPSVVYYNTALVDFERMAERGMEVPNLSDDVRLRWSLEEFRVAAEFASRPRRKTTGLYVPPTLDGLSPFVLSGGGQIFDDEDDPTSLRFSSEDSRSALEAALPVLRDPRLTLTPEQLARRTAATWFERGKLGMIVGDRSLTAAFRRVPGLEFGVLPMPVIDDAATVGGLTGICIAADTPDLAESADLLVDLISTESVQRVVPAGYLVPANQTVALTDDFLQPTRQPRRADVFNDSVRDLYVPPLLDDEAALEDAVEPGIELLLNVEIPDIEALTTQIDEASQAVLAPPEDPTDGPTESESTD